MVRLKYTDDIRKKNRKPKRANLIILLQEFSESEKNAAKITYSSSDYNSIKNLENSIRRCIKKHDFVERIEIHVYHGQVYLMKKEYVKDFYSK